MRDLIGANRIISEISDSNPLITPITPDDYQLFRKFFDAENHTYGNSWTYITQGMYGIGPNKLGYKYYDGKNISAICAYPRIERPYSDAIYWIRPIGKTILDIIAKLTPEMNARYNVPVYVKKVFASQDAFLLEHGFKDIFVLPWHKQSPSEDDTYPEQIIDITLSLKNAAEADKSSRINRAYRYYESISRKNHITYDSIYNKPDVAKEIVDRFFQNVRKRKALNISEPIDFYSMIFHEINPDQAIENILLVNGQPTCFYFLEKQSVSHASQYATITLREYSNHIVDFMMFAIMKNLQAENIRYLNLGGSENASLNDFKLKFQPFKQIQMHWAVYV
jgi:hypothetical protein